MVLIWTGMHTDFSDILETSEESLKNLFMVEEVVEDQVRNVVSDLRYNLEIL